MTFICTLLTDFEKIPKLIFDKLICSMLCSAVLKFWSHHVCLLFFTAFVEKKAFEKNIWKLMFLFSVSLTKELFYWFIATAYKSIYFFHMMLLVGNIALYTLNTMYRAL